MTLVTLLLIAGIYLAFFVTRQPNKPNKEVEWMRRQVKSGDSRWLI